MLSHICLVAKCVEPQLSGGQVCSATVCLVYLDKQLRLKGILFFLYRTNRN